MSFKTETNKPLNAKFLKLNFKLVSGGGSYKSTNRISFHNDSYEKRILF